jgi:hypothetical protein
MLDVSYLRVGDIEPVVVHPDGDMHNVHVAGVEREVFSGSIP